MDIAVLRLNEESLERIDGKSRQVLSEMRKSNLLCDGTLQTEDGGTFTIHRFVMVMCSSYFKALFSTKLNDRLKRAFCIPGITKTVMHQIIDFAYSLTVEMTEENVIDLLISADQFNVLEMLKICCDFLQNRISPENCLGFRKFAQQFFCYELEQETHRFLMCHFVEVTEQSEEFLEMSLEQVLELLNSDYINVSNEQVVWEAGLKWIEHFPYEREVHMDSIMKCTRLGLVDKEYFADFIKEYRYVKSNEKCKALVIETQKFLREVEMIGQRTHELGTPPLAMPRIPYAILFTIGGWLEDVPTTRVETYDSKADRWIQVDVADPEGPRAYHKLALIGYDIYVIGGFNGSHYFNSCRCFNTVTKVWKEVAPMTARRCYVSVATVNNLIYAMGGNDGRYRLNSAERYDYQVNQWTIIAPMTEQRSDASAANLNGRIYIVGGYNGTECLSSGEVYDPCTGIWAPIASMQDCRSGVSTINYHGHLYALGGFNRSMRLNSGEKYDPATNQWTAIPDMFCRRSNFAIEVLDDMIFVIGGFYGARSISDVECYNDSKNEWTVATGLHGGRSALSACVVPGLLNVSDYAHKDRSNLMEEKRQVIQRLKRHNRALSLPLQQLASTAADVNIAPEVEEQERDLDEVDE